MILRRKGFEVVEAGSVREASKALAAKRFDATVIDFYLADGTGAELLRAAGDRRPRTVVMVSADEVKALDDHTFFFKKPVDLDVVVALLVAEGAS